MKMYWTVPESMESPTPASGPIRPILVFWIIVASSASSPALSALARSSSSETVMPEMMPPPQTAWVLKNCRWRW